MKKITLLAVLQQSEYDFFYFERWLERHRDEDELLIKPERWTTKLVLISFFSSLFFFLPAVRGLQFAKAIVSIPENLLRNLIYSFAEKKLSRYKKRGLQIVVIAGSFAKTSTKHLMLNLLKDSIAVLATPASVNTKLGIAKIINRQLRHRHQLFIVELGEYQLGDMETLLNFVQPQWGILTPLADQHLERMGSFQNVIKTFEEVVDFFANKSEALLVHRQNERYFKDNYPKLIYYPSTGLQINKVQVDRRGTHFDLKAYDLTEMRLFTQLYGKHQLENALPAFFIAQKLSLSLADVAKRFDQLPFIEHRHQPVFLHNDILVLDNGYNTNPQAITTSLELLAQLSKSQKIVVTMGFVELGDQEMKENFSLGELLAKKTDLLGVVNSAHANMIKQGFLKTRSKQDIFIGTSAKSIIQKMQIAIKPGATILIEGGDRELYQ